jgi:predicted metal-dependent phosphotriesterase family hydrolase
VIIRTVLGDISPSDFGPCDAHEHLFLDTPAQPGEEFLDPTRRSRRPARSSRLSVEHEDRNFEQPTELIERGFLLARNTLKPLLV